MQYLLKTGTHQHHNFSTCPDNIPTMASVMMSDAVSDVGRSSRYGTPATVRSRQRGGSRPQGPPSESVGPQSDDEGFADDQVPSGRGRPKQSGRPVPRVVDEVGVAVQIAFEEFLETYVF